MSIFNRLVNFIKRKSSRHSIFYLWEVDSKEAKIIKSKTGLEVNGYSHTIDTCAIEHIKNAHSDLELNDIAKIPNIISNYDVIYNAGERNNINHIGYEKETKKGIFVYIEEILTGRKELRSKTYYKK